MKKTTELALQLKSYFGAKIIGSYLFFEEGLVDEGDINDVDVVPGPGRNTELKNYLKDNGFSTVDDIRFTNNEYDKPIDVIKFSIADPTTVPDLIRYKYNRGFLDDLRQLEKVIKAKINKDEPVQ